jgi:glucose-6-phosphate isomerase
MLALKHLSHKNIFPITSSRPFEIKKCLGLTKPEDSIVIPISRSGETLDINSTIGIFREKEYNFLGISSRGKMNEILREMESPILEVPDLSGRFAASITNVAIVPAYISGIKVHEFLKGLDDGYSKFMDYEKNLATEFAISLFKLYKNEYKIAFFMPYSKNLEGAMGLFVQEISESTGKEGKGLMGAYQEAPLCQHSVLEYLLGGKKGAVIPILSTLKEEPSDFKLNSDIDYIDGNSAQTIINYQADSTFQALLKQSIPTSKITIEKPDAATLGQLIAFIQSSVYYLCLLMDVNWANNPKVNIGKEICNEAIKDKISEEKRRKTREEIAEKVFESKI